MKRQSYIQDIKNSQATVADKLSDMALPYELTDDIAKSYGVYQIHEDTEYVYIDRILRDELCGRYVVYYNQRDGKRRNHIIDSYFMETIYHSPQLFVTHNIDKIREYMYLSPSSYALSPYIAELLGLPRVPLTDILAMLNIDMKQVKKNLTAIKKQKKTLTLLGFGGFSRNFLYILRELAIEANIFQIFKDIEIYEYDNIEISNIFRFLDTSWKDILEDTHHYDGTYERAIQTVTEFPKLKGIRYNLTNNYGCLSFKRKLTGYFCKFQPYAHRYSSDSERILLGTPDLETRARIHEFMPNSQYLCPTHNNNKMYLWANPKVEQSAMVETYGKIDLNTFFLESYLMCVEIIKHIAEENYTKQDELLSSICLTEENLNYKKTSRKYRIDLATQVEFERAIELN